MYTSGQKKNNKKRCIFYSTRSAASKLDRVRAYDKEPQTSKLHIFPITGSREVTSKLRNFLFPLLLGLWPPNSTWWWLLRRGYLSHFSHYNSNETNKKHYICISTRLVATKLDEVMFMALGHHAQSHIILWSRCHMLFHGN